MKRMKFESGKNLWFTSDHHFGHDKIIEPDYADRPFTTIPEMDDAMIERWNAVVKPEDTVFYLGDFAIVKDKARIARERTQWLLDTLHGKKHLVPGNHDHSKGTLRLTRRPVSDAPDAAMLNGWESIEWYREITVGDQPIVLSHYPFLTWNGSHRGSWMLHGHCHDGLKKWKCHNCEHALWNTARRCDVGVDAWDFTPIGIEQIAAYMAEIKFEPVDHHREREE